jgi:hypothetical protein
MKECDELLASFVRQLSPLELSAEFGAPLDHAYIQLALTMQQRGFMLAQLAAAELAGGVLAQEPWLRRVATRIQWAAQRSATTLRQSRAGTLKALRRGRAALRSMGAATPLVSDGRKRFSAIYRSNVFGGEESRSGRGSSLGQTAVIRKVLPALLSELKVRVLLDAPCGDSHWIQQVNFPGIKYVGADIVTELIEENRRRYAGPAREFSCLDLACDQLPSADLILCRDCLVHLPFEQSLNILRNFRRSGARYALVTTFPNTKENVDLGEGGLWRPLNLQAPPFNLPDPLQLIVEHCTEADGAYRDKSLGLWELSSVKLE